MSQLFLFDEPLTYEKKLQKVSLAKKSRCYLETDIGRHSVRLGMNEYGDKSKYCTL